jgi:AcrR family transcriptional regulator
MVVPGPNTSRPHDCALCVLATRLLISGICSKFCQAGYGAAFAAFDISAVGEPMASLIRDRIDPRDGPTGRRELNKRDKLLRIKRAARDLFRARGFDETTTREIAERAGVALGTLFTYASNKRDLLFLVGNDALEELAQAAADTIDARLSLIDNLLAAFRPLYDFFGSQPELSKLLLRELVFYDSGEQAERAIGTRMQMIAVASEIVRIASAKREIATPEDPERIGWVIFSVYQAEVRFWLRNDDRDIDRGIERLKRALAVVVAGLGWTAEAGTALPEGKAVGRNR